MNKEEERLDRLLLKWEVSKPDSEEMERAIWERIAEWEDRPKRSVLPFHSVRQKVVGIAAAAAVFMGALLAGIGLAELKNQHSPKMVSVESSEQAYFDSLNPFALAHTHPR